jgi:lysophospholipase L1-like esterase
MTSTTQPQRGLTYVALGDSISIDDYTGVVGGGAASQLARLTGSATFVNLTIDGNTTAGVLSDLDQIREPPDLVTLTAGGNDFLLAAVYGADPSTKQGWADLVDKPLANLASIAVRLQEYGCPVILNTIYDPTDGNNEHSNEIGLPPALRPAFEALNGGIRSLVRRHGFLLADLQTLFREHGIGAKQTWIVRNIEPNFAGATAIANLWYDVIHAPRFACPCCGYLTLSERPPGTYQICDICFWEDDYVQSADPDYEGGANRESLRQAQEAFAARRLGVGEPSLGRNVRDTDRRDPVWKPLPPR